MKHFMWKNIPPCFLYVLFIFPLFSYAQHPDTGASAGAPQYIYIRNIEISGNKKTKEFIFKREMSFWEGDYISEVDLLRVLEQNRKHIINTSLFNTVNIFSKPVTSDTADIIIDVVERWYIFPSLQFSLVDRNFNEWWQEFDHDLSRTIYGGSLYLDNLRGRDDRLNFTVVGGYNQIFSMAYSVPYITKTSPFGVVADFKYLRSKESIYTAIDNKLLSFEYDDYLREYFYGGVSFRYRKNLFLNHFLHFDYYHNQIADTLAAINPDFFLDGKTSQRYFQLGYEVIYDKRDISAYALEGYLMSILLLKRGLGIFNDINMTVFRSNFVRYFDLGSNFYSTHSLRSKLSFPFKQPYYNQQALGYQEDLVRGYELYVVDGQHFLLNRNTFKYKFLSFVINKPLISIKYFNHIPFDFYATTHVDWGFTSDRYYYDANPLNNQFLIGAGIGLDVVTYYDTNISITYSINRMLEKGLYLHIGL